jgi:hypothetical protein
MYQYGKILNQVTQSVGQANRRRAGSEDRATSGLSWVSTVLASTSCNALTGNEGNQNMIISCDRGMTRRFMALRRQE